MNRLEVTVLKCPSCGAPVPLGEGESVPCVYCRALVEVPEEHRALRAAEREHNLHRSAAHDLARRLSKPPSAVVRFLTDVHGGTVIWLVSLGTIVSGLVCAAAFLLASRLSRAWFHVDIDDVVLYRYDPNALFVIGQYAFLLASLGSLVVWGAYARRRGAGLRELQAGLSAGLPARPGGPATCRECGAPLSAKANDVTVTCPYCTTDNLLHIPETWIGAARARTRKLAGAVEAAAYAFQDEVRSIRRSLAVRLAVVLVISSTILFLFIGMTDGAKLEGSTVTAYHRLGQYSFDWQKAVASPWLTLDQGDAKGCRGFSCELPLRKTPCSERGKTNPFVMPAGACDAEACMVHWYVALRHGDVVEVTANGLPPKAFVALDSHRRDAPFHANAAGWGTTVVGQFGWLTDGNSARLTAPHDGWFQVNLGTDSTVVGAPLDLCARLERTAP